VVSLLNIINERLENQCGKMELLGVTDGISHLLALHTVFTLECLRYVRNKIVPVTLIV
jgi:hypothetical protein